ncbi:MAG: hypothetical protein ACO3FE_09335 [Planctomycetaceae bacterium]
MRILILLLALSTAFPGVADERNIDSSELPVGIHGFNGMLVGQVKTRDAETGKFTLKVQAVPRVWRNSGAEDPSSIIGRTVEVSGVFGRFLDVLVVTRPGDTMEFECKHDGEKLVFPGELLRKVAPYDPADYPTLPEGFRGFVGTIVGDIQKKDAETFELILKVSNVLNTSDNSKAKKPQSIEGRSLMLAGFWNRRDAYHNLRPGARVRVGVKHIGLRSEHLTVTNNPQVLSADAKMEMKKETAGVEVRDGLNSSQRGFRGMLVGRVTERDPETGSFSVIVDAVPRVWKNNQARDPRSFLGQTVNVAGVSGRLIDTLVTTRKGETLEFGAIHDGGATMRVIEELRKVAPVKPGDYPTLPDDFRGFRGTLQAKVISKGEGRWDLIVEVTRVEQNGEESRAKNSSAIVGKQVMLAGFWNRKEFHGSLKPGDLIRCTVEHPQRLTDHLSVTNQVGKVGQD